MLPPNLTKLTFGCNFYQSLTAGVLPPNLTHLTFSHEFNRALVVGALPPNLTHLTFGRDFNQLLALDVLPNLKLVTFYHPYRRCEDVLPNGCRVVFSNYSPDPPIRIYF